MKNLRVALRAIYRIGKMAYPIRDNTMGKANENERYVSDSICS